MRYAKGAHSVVLWEVEMREKEREKEGVQMHRLEVELLLGLRVEA